MQSLQLLRHLSLSLFTCLKYLTVCLSVSLSLSLSLCVCVCVSLSPHLKYLLLYPFLGPDGLEIRPVRFRPKIRPVRLGLHFLFSKSPSPSPTFGLGPRPGPPLAYWNSSKVITKMTILFKCSESLSIFQSY